MRKIIMLLLVALVLLPTFAAAEEETTSTEPTTETATISDRDSDGIPDGQDLYPDDPENKPMDRDSDGIPDGQDLYPDDAENKLPTTPVLSDRDSDGIPDGQDLYPDDAENKPAAFDESSEAAQNKYTHNLLIGIAGLLLVGLVMGRKSLL